MEDPHLMVTVCTAHSQQMSSNKELGATERQSLQLQAWCDTLQVKTATVQAIQVAYYPISYHSAYVSTCNKTAITQIVLLYLKIKFLLSQFVVRSKHPVSVYIVIQRYFPAVVLVNICDDDHFFFPCILDRSIDDHIAALFAHVSQ